MPMSSRKTFAKKSFKQKKLQDAWFGRDANYFKIKSTPMYSYSSIDIQQHDFGYRVSIFGKQIKYFFKGIRFKRKQ